MGVCSRIEVRANMLQFLQHPHSRSLCQDWRWWSPRCCPGTRCPCHAHIHDLQERREGPGGCRCQPWCSGGRYSGGYQGVIDCTIWLWIYEEPGCKHTTTAWIGLNGCASFLMEEWNIDGTYLYESAMKNISFLLVLNLTLYCFHHFCKDWQHYLLGITFYIIMSTANISWTFSVDYFLSFKVHSQLLPAKYKEQR